MLNAEVVWSAVIAAAVIMTLLLVLLATKLLSSKRPLNFERLIEASIVDQLAHEEEMRKHRFQFRKDQRQRSIIQRVERRIGRTLSPDHHKVIIEKLQEREK